MSAITTHVLDIALGQPGRGITVIIERLTDQGMWSELARGNQAYREKFGYIFIVCATGKTADEMLALLRARIDNTPEAEIRIAADEQRKITRIRLEKLLHGH